MWTILYLYTSTPTCYYAFSNAAGPMGEFSQETMLPPKRSLFCLFRLPSKVTVMRSKLRSVDMIPIVTFTNKGRLRGPRHGLASRLRTLLRKTNGVLLPVDFFKVVGASRQVVFKCDLPRFLRNFRSRPVSSMITTSSDNTFESTLRGSFGKASVTFIINFIQGAPLSMVVIRFRAAVSRHFHRTLGLFCTLMIIMRRSTYGITISNVRRTFCRLVNAFSVVSHCTKTTRIPVRIIMRCRQSLASMGLLMTIGV